LNKKHIAYGIAICVQNPFQADTALIDEWVGNPFHMRLWKDKKQGA